MADACTAFAMRGVEGRGSLRVWELRKTGEENRPCLRRALTPPLRARWASQSDDGKPNISGLLTEDKQSPTGDGKQARPAEPAEKRMTWRTGFESGNTSTLLTRRFLATRGSWATCFPEGEGEAREQRALI